MTAEQSAFMIDLHQVGMMQVNLIIWTINIYDGLKQQANINGSVVSLSFSLENHKLAFTSCIWNALV